MPELVKLISIASFEVMPSNAHALSRVLLEERPSLMRLVQRIVKNEPSAEDVTQLLWLKIQRVSEHPPIENPRAFLFRLAANLAKDHLRSKRSYAASQAEAQAFLWSELQTPSPEQAAIDRAELARVLAAAQTLPEPTRSMFHQHRFGGLTYTQIAARHGVSTTTVENHIKRALAVLRAARDKI